MSRNARQTSRFLHPGAAFAAAALLGLLAACGGGGQPATPTGASHVTEAPGAAALARVPGPPGPPAPASAPAPAGFKLLKTNPEKGNAGTPFTITGEGLPTGKPVQFVWVTWDGSYVTKSLPETVQFFDRQFVEKRVLLAPSSGPVAIDDAGRFTANFAAPEDYGEIHDIYAVVDGLEVAKAGFRIVRKVTIAPTEGPIGTPITIQVNGLAWKPFESTLAVRYDNKYTGFLAATTTRGTVTAQVRAAGPVGMHTIDVGQSSAAVPYLNPEQSPVAQLGSFRFTFNVTKDAGPPEATIDWPENGRVAVNPSTLITTADSSLVSAVSAVFSTSSGPILSAATVKAIGLPPDADVDLLWVTAKGNRISPSGWNLEHVPLTKARAGKDGSLSAAIQIPDDLGGWHVVKLVQGEKVLAQAPYFVERSIGGVTPRRVKAGETFQVQIKGVGWTELDNGFAVTYDNAYIGYSCGFNSQGDVTMNLVATGGPGTHLIDIYPMIFQGQGKPPWDYELPILSFRQDAPGLALGYRLPAFRLAIQVTD